MRRSEFKFRLDELYRSYYNWNRCNEEDDNFYYNRMVRLENKLYKDLFPKK